MGTVLREYRLMVLLSGASAGTSQVMVYMPVAGSCGGGGRQEASPVSGGAGRTLVGQVDKLVMLAPIVAQVINPDLPHTGRGFLHANQNAIGCGAKCGSGCHGIRCRHRLPIGGYQGQVGRTGLPAERKQDVFSVGSDSEGFRGCAIDGGCSRPDAG